MCVSTKITKADLLDIIEKILSVNPTIESNVSVGVPTMGDIVESAQKGTAPSMTGHWTCGVQWGWIDAHTGEVWAVQLIDRKMVYVTIEGHVSSEAGNATVAAAMESGITAGIPSFIQTVLMEGAGGA